MPVSSSSRRTAVLAATWAITLALCFKGLGAYLDEWAEGVLLEQIPLAWPGLALLAVFASLGLTVWWARPVARDADLPARSTRRRFLAGSLVGIAGLIASAAAALARNWGWLRVTAPVTSLEVPRTHPRVSAEWRGARVRSYRRLGRTDFHVSDISLGSGMITEENDGEAIAREAIERGVNYFDTSPDYSGAGSERALGHALRGVRDRMFVATKFCRDTTPHGHLRAGSSVREYMDVVHASLRRLQTDYVDLVHVHSCNQVDRILDPNLHEAFARLREQGKARFLGVSTHTPNLESVAQTAIDDGRFDVIMLAYHHGAWPQLGEIVRHAAQRDVGVVAMKTLKGAKHRGMAAFRDDADAFSQAAFKWVLSNPDVSCLVVSFFLHQHLDEYLFASGKRLAEADLALLERYDRLVAGTRCRPHCGACLSSCPHGVPIDDVLRYRMYFEDYGREKYAMQLYETLEKRAALCVGCAAPCAGSCPEGISIRERSVEAHRMLSIG